MAVHLAKPEALPSSDKTAPFDVEKFQIQPMDAKTPIALPSDPTEAFSPKADAGKEQWQEVKKVWDEKEGVSKQTVELWKSIGLAKLGWTKKKIESSAGILTGSKPKKIVSNLPKYYLWAPLLSKS